MEFTPHPSTILFARRRFCIKFRLHVQKNKDDLHYMTANVPLELCKEITDTAEKVDKDWRELIKDLLEDHINGKPHDSIKVIEDES